MLGTLRDLAVLIAALAGAPVAVAAALRLPFIRTPTGYLLRVLIVHPLTSALVPAVVKAIETAPVLEAIDQAVNSRAEGDPTMSVQLNTVSETVDRIDTRLGDGDRRFDEIDQRFDADHERIEDHEARLVTLEAQITGPNST